MWYHVVWYRYHCCRETCCLCHQNKTLSWVWRNGTDKGKGGPQFQAITCPHLYQFFHAHCTLISWTQRQQVPSERWYIPNHMVSHSRRFFIVTIVKSKGLPQQAEVAHGVPGRLRPQIFLTFGTTRVVGRQPYTPAAFTPGEIPGTHF